MKSKLWYMQITLGCTLETLGVLHFTGSYNVWKATMQLKKLCVTGWCNRRRLGAIVLAVVGCVKVTM